MSITFSQGYVQRGEFLTVMGKVVQDGGHRLLSFRSFHVVMRDKVVADFIPGHSSTLAAFLMPAPEQLQAPPGTAVLRFQVTESVEHIYSSPSMPGCFPFVILLNLCARKDI